MKLIRPGFCVFALVILASGCTSTRRPEALPASSSPVPASSAPVPAKSSTVVPPPSSRTPSTVDIPAPVQRPAPDLPGLPPEGEYIVKIESEPSGATVVINGTPVGKTPHRLILSGTSRGFFREQLSLKVRFIATSQDQTSRTVFEEFSTREKIPSCVRFTPEGASRIAR